MATDREKDLEAEHKAKVAAEKKDSTIPSHERDKEAEKHMTPTAKAQVEAESKPSPPHGESTRAQVGGEVVKFDPEEGPPKAVKSKPHPALAKAAALREKIRKAIEKARDDCQKLREEFGELCGEVDVPEATRFTRESVLGALNEAEGAINALDPDCTVVAPRVAGHTEKVK